MLDLKVMGNERWYYYSELKPFIIELQYSSTYIIKDTTFTTLRNVG